MMLERYGGNEAYMERDLSTIDYRACGLLRDDSKADHSAMLPMRWSNVVQTMLFWSGGKVWWNT
jgi:hypothetical protein